jgi:hypothetical protein
MFGRVKGMDRTIMVLPLPMVWHGEQTAIHRHNQSIAPKHEFTLHETTNYSYVLLVFVP